MVHRYCNGWDKSHGVASRTDLPAGRESANIKAMKLVSPCGRAFPWTVVLLLLGFFPKHLLAVESLELQIGTIQADSWLATDVRMSLGLATQSKLSLTVELASLQINGQGEVLTNASWYCPELAIQDDVYACDNGILQTGGGLLGSQNFSLQVRFQDVEHWSFTVDGLSYAKGRLKGGLVMEDGAWRGTALATGMRLESLRALLPADWIPAAWVVTGTLAVDGVFSGRQDQLTRIEARISAQKLFYSDEGGLQVGEDLAFTAGLSGNLDHDGWHGEGQLQINKGQFYSDPLYLAIGAAPLAVSARGQAKMPLGHIAIEQLEINFPDTLSVTGSATVVPGDLALQNAALEFSSDSFGKLYASLLQPLLIGSSLDELDVTGGLQGSVRIMNGVPEQFDLLMRNVSLDDKTARFGLDGLNAELHWLAEGDPVVSSLGFRRGYVYKIGFGGLEAVLRAGGDALQLLEPVRLPLLGGTMEFRDLAFSGLQQSESQWQMAASLEHIQLTELSTALDWPQLSGEMHGTIPTVKYQAGNIKLDGQLTMDVFGGRIAVNGLSIADPLGVASVLESDIRMDNLDLAQLTQTFSFGRIDGLLEGTVTDLQLISWHVNSFKANFQTPEGGSGRRRISQRAVDNLTSLGSGVPGGLSSTFLSAFKDFGYDRITLQIDLSGARAELDGLDHPEGGYYIVKGAGLPRIDVIGRNREVAWKDLIERLQDIQFEGMVIQ